MKTLFVPWLSVCDGHDRMEGRVLMFQPEGEEDDLDIFDKIFEQLGDESPRISERPPPAPEAPPD